MTPKTLRLSIWEINQGQTPTFKLPSNPSNLDRGFLYLRDYTGDGKIDILENRLPNQVINLTQANGTVNTFSLTDPTLNTTRQSWDIQTTSDYNGDGISDLTLKDANNGTTKIWLFNNSLIPPQTIPLNQLDTSIWKLIA